MLANSELRDDSVTGADDPTSIAAGAMADWMNVPGGKS